MLRRKRSGVVCTELLSGQVLEDMSSIWGMAFCQPPRLREWRPWSLLFVSGVGKSQRWPDRSMHTARFHALAFLEIEHVGHHRFSIELEVMDRLESPGGQLTIGPFCFLVPC